MSTRMHVKASERGIVRLFAIDLPAPDASMLDVETVGRALGGVALDPEQVDLIAPGDLEDIGLDGYLIHGIGVPRSEVVQVAPRLKALKGHVALIRSAAFGGMSATLTPRKPLRWIASFGEAALDLTAPPLHSKAATGNMAQPAPQPGKQPLELPRSFKIALASFLLIVALMLALMVR